ncbi:hypothetical protein HNR46_000434 [Haloferula luteola]|uniref:PEP-CTERM protein-sorting domain-containing protein n=1 Tax=Haloferula luteola TaxID=595692 RepID=A0A840V8D1_9BACT|nr:PEP-CTERM sorting domain-containing protein [Haloferula luteola]MBB5350210.1 hypothetical protein [Haloferula luteola]
MKFLPILFVATPAFAANIVLNADDSYGNSSFNSAGNWSSASYPDPGNDYFTQGHLLRTPTSSSSYNFAGDSLTVTGSAAFSAANNEALMWKGSGTTATITISNLIVDGGQIRHGAGDGDSVTFFGSITVGASGMGIASQGGFNIASAIHGDSTIYILGNGTGSTQRMVTFTSAASTFHGDLILNSENSLATLAENSVFHFKMGSDGINNSIEGIGWIALNGSFALDLSGASTTYGDAWSLVSVATAEYGDEFSIEGFHDLGEGRWAQGIYQFDQATGTLSVVPEPSAILLSGIALGLGLHRRRP